MVSHRVLKPSQRIFGQGQSSTMRVLWIFLWALEAKMRIMRLSKLVRSMAELFPDETRTKSSSRRLVDFSPFPEGSSNPYSVAVSRFRSQRDAKMPPPIFKYRCRLLIILWNHHKLRDSWRARVPRSIQPTNELQPLPLKSKPGQASRRSGLLLLP